jgi:hypothetical protein
LLLQYVVVNPADMLVNDDGSAAGGIMGLREMFLEHPRAEARFSPGDFLALIPGYRLRHALYQIE